jgi:GH18 family chitinase
MKRIVTGLCLPAISFVACSAPPTPLVNLIITQATEPTLIPSPSAPQFIVLAYATEGIIADVIPYDQLTHINYAFLTPKEDGTFHPLKNGWKLEEIVRNAHEHDVHVCISVGGWGWDTQFEALAAAGSGTRTAFVHKLKALADTYQLDGVETDWACPDRPGKNPDGAGAGWRKYSPS